MVDVPARRAATECGQRCCRQEASTKHTLLRWPWAFLQRSRHSQVAHRDDPERLLGQQGDATAALLLQPAAAEAWQAFLLRSAAMAAHRRLREASGSLRVSVLVDGIVEAVRPKQILGTMIWGRHMAKNCTSSPRGRFATKPLQLLPRVLQRGSGCHLASCPQQRRAHDPCLLVSTSARRVFGPTAPAAMTRGQAWPTHFVRRSTANRLQLPQRQTATQACCTLFRS